MKKCFVLNILLLTSFWAFCQTNFTKAGIEEIFEGYNQKVKAGNDIATLDYMHPAFFKNESKEERIQEMEERHETELEVIMGGLEVTDISKVLKYK